MLANSGLAALAVTVRGSSAMPQIGQVPGPSRTICGCMGQVYSMRSVAAEGWVGSSAIPHFGQAPALGRALRDAWGRCIERMPQGLGGSADGYQGSSLRAVVFARVSLELCLAALGTEVPGASCVVRRMLRLFPAALSCRIPDRPLPLPHLPRLTPVIPPAMVRVSTKL